MNELHYTRIVMAAMSLPWAILPGKLAVIQSLLHLRAQGHRLTAEEVGAQLAAGGRGGEAAMGRGSVAVLPLVGTIIPRGDLLLESSGAMSVQRFGSSFRQALADTAVGHIVLDVDSPGGQVGGVAELAAEIFRARGQKRIVAVANHLAASGAYWIASAADEVVISPSGEVGSIGVLAMHEDMSQLLESTGVKINLITAGKYKGEGSPFEVLGDDARAAIQARVDEYYAMFTGDVARHRGVTRAEVVNGFGQGRVVGASMAVALGMADRVGTLAETVQRLLKSGPSVRGRASSVDYRRARIRAASGGGSIETGLD